MRITSVFSPERIPAHLQQRERWVLLAGDGSAYSFPNHRRNGRQPHAHPPRRVRTRAYYRAGGGT
jgi:hypothetical protein